LNAQNSPVGSWRTHFSYYQINSIAEAGDYIYAAAENGLFRISKTNLKTVKISRLQGLSDIRISRLAYHEALQTLIIAYENGNIDLIDNQGFITNVDDIIRSTSIIGSKRINHVYIRDEFAFLSCDFGVVKLDVDRVEVAEDYRNLSLGGVSIIEIYASTIDPAGDSIYLSTSQGIMQAPYDDRVNLQDVNNWRLFTDTSDGIPTSNYGEMIFLDNTLIVASNIPDDQKIYQYRNGIWTSQNPNLSQDIVRLKKSAGKMVLISAYQVQIWSQISGPDTVIFEPDTIPLPTDFIIDDNNNWWLGSPKRGLMSNLSGSWDYYSPNGPFTDLVSRMEYYDNRIVVASGGRATNFRQLNREFGYSEFIDGQWVNYVPNEIPNLNYFGSFMKDLYEPYYYRSADILAIGSIGYGVLMKLPGDTFVVYNQFNSTLSNIDPGGFPSTRVTAIAEDNDGNLILANPETPTPVHIFNPDDGWSTLPFGAPSIDRIDEMLVDSDNNVWCRLINLTGGMLVFNRETIQTRNLSTAEGNGSLPDNSVNTMTMDRNGDIWVGTNDGIAVFFNPERIFRDGGIEASTPIFENRPLLRDEIIRCIEVDAANRKWVGTNNGVWLFEEDGTEVVANFTTGNSPLLDDRIVDIEINDLNGEVFFATEAGIISYRGTATELENICDDIKVFPNPVRPGYEGFASIYGIPENANVKITDISGKLFYETNATGNSVSWNLRNYNNEKMKAGVYLILTSSEDGEQSCTTKITIVD
jgi:hypothetical protein